MKMKKILVLFVCSSLFMSCATGKYVWYYWSKGNEAFSEKNYAAAIKAYSARDLLLYGGGSIDKSTVLTRRGWAYLYSGRPQKAKKDFIEALKIKPNLEHAKKGLYSVSVPLVAVEAYDRGSRAADEKKYDLAIEEYTQAILLYPEYKYAYNGRCASYIYKGMRFYDQAVADCIKAIDIDPEYTDPYVNLGVINQNRSNYTVAMSYYNKAILLNDQYEPALNRKASLGNYMAIQGALELANASRSKKDYDTAIAQYKKVLELDPNHAGAKNNIKAIWFELANASRSKKDYDTAIAQYKKVLELDQNDAGAKDSIKAIWFELANASRNRKDYDAAIAQYKEVLKLEKNNTEANGSLKTVWDERIAANPKLYPAPFQGKWQFYSPAIFIPGTPDRTETYFEPFKHPQTGQYTTVTRTRTIPGTGTPSTSTREKRIVYEFNGKNYTMTGTEGSKTGTFYYSGNNIELDNGTFLILSEDKKSIIGYTKQ
jgi:tetratricopeptide (TPR) repeat protein